MASGQTETLYKCPDTYQDSGGYTIVTNEAKIENWTLHLIYDWSRWQ